MRFFGETHINFVGTRRKAFILSGALIIAGLISLIVKGGPSLSIDFEGGTLIQVRFDKAVPIDELRKVIDETGYHGGEIQQFGAHNEYLIKVKKINEADYAASKLVSVLKSAYPNKTWNVVAEKEIPPDLSKKIEGGTMIKVETDSFPPLEEVKVRLKEHGLGLQAATMEGSNRCAFRLPFLGVESKVAEKIKAELMKEFPDRKIDIRRTETVGPKIGEELKSKAWAAIIISMIGILIYISWRFEFKFAVGAIVALIHDVTITVGIFSILNKELSLAIIAALLTIVGYSLNDTIVVFDRIRENFSLRRRESYENMVNISINESLSRTIITSLTTIIVILFLLFMGGEVIHDFAFALFVGVVVGTYSSVYVASPILIEWQSRSTTKKRSKR